MQAGLKAGGSLDSIAGRVATATKQGINEVRALSRASGVARLRSEASSLGRSIVTDGSWLPTEVVRDINRADLYSKSYAEQWLKKANAAEETVAKAAKAASAESIGSLKRTAVTESSEAFSSGRAKYLRSSSSLGLLRVWDATLDKRGCPICAEADGTIVGAREPFPFGEPGSVHPACRCSWTLLTSSQDDRGTLVAPHEIRRPQQQQVRKALIDTDGPKVSKKAGELRDAVNQVGAINVKRPLVGMRDESMVAARKAFQGLSPEQATQVALGRRDVALSDVTGGKRLQPIQINVYPDGTHLVDGRHRLIAASEAGATEISAEITRIGPRGGVQATYRGPVKIGTPTRRGLFDDDDGDLFSLGDGPAPSVAPLVDPFAKPKVEAKYAGPGESIYEFADAYKPDKVGQSGLREVAGKRINAHFPGATRKIDSIACEINDSRTIDVGAAGVYADGKVYIADRMAGGLKDVSRLKRLKLGDELDKEDWTALGSARTMVHEELHGHSRSRGAFRRAGAVLEEVCTELSARFVTRAETKLFSSIVDFDVNTTHMKFKMYQDYIDGVVGEVSKIAGVSREAAGEMIVKAHAEKMLKAGAMIDDEVEALTEWASGLPISQAKQKRLVKALQSKYADEFNN